MGDYLKDYREESGFSQEQAANALGVTRQALSNWENGKTEPDTKSLSALARLYGKTVDALLHGDPEEQQPEEVPEEQPEELMAEAPEELPIEPFAVVSEEAPATQKKSLSAKTRAWLLALAVLLGLAIGFAAGWWACDYVQSHKVYEEQIDLSESRDTFDLFPLEDN